jgi:hypothetical protein
MFHLTASLSGFLFKSLLKWCRSTCASLGWKFVDQIHLTRYMSIIQRICINGSNIHQTYQLGEIVLFHSFRSFEFCSSRRTMNEFNYIIKFSWRYMLSVAQLQHYTFIDPKCRHDRSISSHLLAEK